jgi:hypothetical protein
MRNSRSAPAPPQPCAGQLGGRLALIAAAAVAAIDMPSHSHSAPLLVLPPESCR